MKKQVKALLLLAMILVMAAMTMLVSFALDAEQADTHYYKVSVFEGKTETVKGYAATLADAVAGAEAGDTITLLQDVTEAEVVVINKSLTINGNGKVTTATARWINITAGAVTLQDCEVRSTASTSTAPLVQVSADGVTLTVNGGLYACATSKTDTKAYIFSIGDSTTAYPNTKAAFTGVEIYSLASNGGYCLWAGLIGELTLDDCHIAFIEGEIDMNTSYASGTNSATGLAYGRPFCVGTYATTTTIADSTLYANSANAALYGLGTGTIDLINVTATGYRIAYVGKSTINVHSGSYSPAPGYVNCQLFVLNTAGGTLNIYGGSFTTREGSSDNATGYGIIRATNSNSTVNIYGGTFTDNDTRADKSMITLAYKTTVTVHAKGTAYTDYNGEEQTSAGATFVRNGAGRVFYLASTGATVTVGNGTAVILTNGAYLVGQIKGSFSMTGVDFTVDAAVIPQVKEDCTYTVTAPTGFTLGDGDEIAAASDLVAVAQALLTANGTDTAGIGFADCAKLHMQPGAKLTITGGEYTSSIPLITLFGGELEIQDGKFTTTDRVMNTYGGKVTVQNGTFSTTKYIFVAYGDTELVVNNGSFTKTGNTNTTAYYGIFYLSGNNNSLTVNNGNFLLEDGGSVVYYTGGQNAEIEVNGGTFKKNNNEDNGVAEESYTATYAYGAIFHFAGTGADSDAYSATLTVNGGTYTTPSFVRIYTVCTNDGENAAASTASSTYGVKVYISNVTITGNADSAVGTDDRYMLQIARAGHHLIEITEEKGDVTVTVSKNSVLFYANAAACALGSQLKIDGGEYKGGKAWFGNTVDGITYTVANATFTDTDGDMAGVNSGIVQINKTNKATFTDCTFTLKSAVFLFNMANTAAVTLNDCTVTHSATKVTFNVIAAGNVLTINGGYYEQKNTSLIDHSNGPTTTINGGTFVAKQFMADRSGTVNVNGGLFIILGSDALVFRTEVNSLNLNKAVVVTNSTISVDRSNAMTAGTTSKWGDVTLVSTNNVIVTPGTYALEVNYGGKSYKLWATDQGDFENTADAGASLYVNTEQASTSGIRFDTVIEQSVIDAILAKEEYAGATLKYYTLIAPMDYVASVDGVFTKEALETLAVDGAKYVAILAKNTLNTTNGVTYSGALINLKSYTRIYAAVSMIEVVKDGTVVDTLYSDYSTTANARTAQQVALAVQQAEEYDLMSMAQQAIVNSYANGVVSEEE